MKKIFSILFIFIAFNQMLIGQVTSKNRFEVNGFNVRGSNTEGMESTRASGVNVVYTRYLWKGLNIGLAAGFGDFNGRGTVILERFDDFPELERDYRQFQVKLGYDIYQTNRIRIGVQADYLRRHYRGITSRITSGSEGDPGFRESLSFGRISAPSLFLGSYAMVKLVDRVHLKGDLSYGFPSFNFYYEYTQASIGLTYEF